MQSHHAFQFVDVGLRQLLYAFFAWQIGRRQRQASKYGAVAFDTRLNHQHHQRRHIALHDGGKRTKGEKRIGTEETANNRPLRTKSPVGCKA